MSMAEFYLSQCKEAAAKSPMSYNLGAVSVKGGKDISTGYNHHRTHTTTVMSFELMVTESPSLCMLRCMPFTISLACHLRSSNRFKVPTDGPRLKKGSRPMKQHANGCPKDVPSLNVVFQGPPPSTQTGMPSGTSKASEMHVHTHRANSPRVVARNNSYSIYAECPSSNKLGSVTSVYEKGWNTRRRHARANGADIFVARVSKTGLGSAMCAMVSLVGGQEDLPLESYRVEL